MLRLGLTPIKDAIMALMAMRGSRDLILYAKNGVVAFAVVNEDMYRMFCLRVGEECPTVNYLISKEIVAFMFANDTITLEERDDQLILRSEGRVKEDFKQAIIPLRKDYNSELLDNSIAFIQNPQVCTGNDIRVIESLVEICKFQLTGLVIQDGYGMISTNEMRAFRPVNYSGKLVLSNQALTEFLRYIHTYGELGVGTIGRYTVCLGGASNLLGMVNVRESIPPFIKQYQELKCLAEYEVDVHAMAMPLFHIKQEKTQQVELTLNFDKGSTRVFERNKGDITTYFQSTLLRGKPAGDLRTNFKLMKSLLTTKINFGSCKVRVFQASLAFELTNGTVLLVRSAKK